MPKKPFNWRLWAKLIVGGTVISVGGPALTWRLTPSEEELRSRYNPELRQRSLETRDQREREFDDFVTTLKKYSKSDKSIWIVVEEEKERQRQAALDAAKLQQKEAEARQEAMRREMGLAVK